MLVTNLDGNYAVIAVPPASYCSLTITNLYHGNGIANEEVVDEEEVAEAYDSFLQQEEAVDSEEEVVEEIDENGNKIIVENKDYSTLLSIGTLQSSNCILI
mmetsp:Transcript_24563/g.24157  ORF Transcript_24563/g.24157 Transcript_24563/m.24157 type:complete len:101 (-) Transcript_24563:242-544(-)